MSQRQVDYALVDVFTSQAGMGNPAGVVWDAHGLSDAQLQSIAEQLACNETAFVFPANKNDQADLAIRWFTPQCEINMCAHATLAAIHILADQGLLACPAQDDPGMVIHTTGGKLKAMFESPESTSSEPPISTLPTIWLELVPPTVRPFGFTHRLWGELLNIDSTHFVKHPVPVTTNDGDLIVFVDQFATLNTISPDFRALAEYCLEYRLRGLCVATLATITPSLHSQSRFFAPAVGIPEDAVTGSVHGPLAVHLVASGCVPTFHDMAALHATQGIPGGRTGLIQILVQRQVDGTFDVRIGGQCVTTQYDHLSL